MERMTKFFICALVLAILTLSQTVWATDDVLQEDTAVSQAEKLALSEPLPEETLPANLPAPNYFDPLKYVLGPDDVIEITVMRHPEFSGVYPINLEGKIQYKFVGDMEVIGLTKKALEQKIKEVISNFVVSPEINVTILEYKSKVIYVLGEVGQPGKYYMRSETISVREAVVQAGLPTVAAAMRRCRLVTPDNKGNIKTKAVDLYSILYGGNLKENLEMRPGDVLYVPATIMAKIIRVVNPVTTTIGVTSSAPSEVSSAKSAFSTMAK